jgi:hypothetical protein
MNSTQLEYRTKNAISYITSVANMNTSNLDDMLDGINSSDLGRHIEIIKAWKNNDEYNKFCDALILLNNRVYANRYHHDDHYIHQGLIDLRATCKTLVDSL